MRRRVGEETTYHSRSYMIKLRRLLMIAAAAVFTYGLIAPFSPRPAEAQLSNVPARIVRMTKILSLQEPRLSPSRALLVSPGHSTQFRWGRFWSCSRSPHMRVRPRASLSPSSMEIQEEHFHMCFPRRSCKARCPAVSGTCSVCSARQTRTSTPARP
jgi:hypothetical protein